MTAKVFLVDDHPMMRRGYAALLNAQPDLAVCGEAGSSREALPAIAEAQPDLVIADVSLPSDSGIGLTKDLQTWAPDALVLVVSMHDEALYAERALAAGARGYLMKTAGDEALLRAVRRVLAGHVHLSDAVQDRILFRHVGGGLRGQAAPATAVETLSDRELLVFELIGRGLGTREMAEQLSLSPKTIESYRSRIKQKLDVANVQELVRRAIQWVGTIGDPT